jgi:hypothetical protein
MCGQVDFSESTPTQNSSYTIEFGGGRRGLIEFTEIELYQFL